MKNAGRTLLIVSMLAGVGAGWPVLGHDHAAAGADRLGRVIAHAEQAARLAEQGRTYPAAMQAEQAWLLVESHPELSGASLLRSAVSRLREASTFAQAGESRLAVESAADALDALRQFEGRLRNGAS